VTNKLRDLTYVDGNLETSKFAGRREEYYRALETIRALEYTPEEMIHHFPCFVGHLTLARFISLYEVYRKTLGVAGHIADVGVYKGASMLYFTKLTQIYEPTTLTQVHGFDWFRGNEPGTDDPMVITGSSKESYERVVQLVNAQQLQNIVRIHKLDFTKELDAFFERYPHLQFKLIFLDIGTYEAVKCCLVRFWERLTKGGIMVFDQYNFEIAPGETRAVREFFEGKEQVIHTFPSGWMPTAYVVK
jgi:hypothetical protein